MVSRQKFSYHILILAVFLLIAVPLAACGGPEAGGSAQSSGLAAQTDDVPDDVVDFYKEYVAADRRNTGEAVDFVYFNNDWEADFFKNSIDTLESCKIDSMEKINDSLYAFHITYETAASREQGETREGYNFVAVIGGEYRVITNSRNIPEDLKTDFDEEKYKNTAENDITPEDVMGIEVEAE